MRIRSRSQFRVCFWVKRSRERSQLCIIIVQQSFKIADIFGFIVVSWKWKPLYPYRITSALGKGGFLLQSLGMCSIKRLAAQSYCNEIHNKNQRCYYQALTEEEFKAKKPTWDKYQQLYRWDRVRTRQYPQSSAPKPIERWYEHHLKILGSSWKVWTKGQYVQTNRKPASREYW